MNYSPGSPLPTTSSFGRLRLMATRRVAGKGVFCSLRSLVILGTWISYLYLHPLKNNTSYGGSTSSTNSVDQMQASCRRRLDKLEQIFNERRRIRQQATPTYEFKNYKMKFDLYEPEASCFSEERFGSDSDVRYEAFGDGPKFVCGVDVLAQKAKLLGKNCLVYSVGSNNDVRFEKSVHTHITGCEIHTFDPTLTDTPFVGGEYATFHPWGLGTDGGKEGNTMHTRKDEGERMSFQTIIQKLGHTNRTIDILKIDCQGCEYAAMPPLFELIASGSVRVDQVLIELHDTKKANFATKDGQLSQFFSGADKAKLRIVHKERNQWGCDGFRCVEYAFVSESFLREANEAVVCSTEYF